MRLLVGHGQMAPEELERVMLDFVEGRADLLLCTTIIESGLDIPRANTMIVDRADTFGLAQLYQLRGRIGRSTQRAFCYLLAPANDAMTADAKQRLAVLQRFSELGRASTSPVTIWKFAAPAISWGPSSRHHRAHRLRALHPHVGRSGRRATRAADHAAARSRSQLRSAGLYPRRLPAGYRSAPRLYRRLSVAEDEEEIAAVLGEISDRYGAPPEEVAVLGDIMVVKALGRRLQAASIELSETRLALSLRETTPLRPEQVTALVSPRKSPWRITPDQRLVRLWQKGQRARGRLAIGKALLADLLSQAEGTPRRWQRGAQVGTK